MKFQNDIIFYVISFLLVSCNKAKPLKADITYLEQETFKYTELPNSIKEIISHHHKHLKNPKLEKLRVSNEINGEISGIYYLNNDTLRFKSKPPEPFYNTEYFILKDRMYSLSIHNNTINEPLIFIDDNLYFTKTRNLKFCDYPDSLFCTKLESYYLNAVFGRVILPK